MDAADQPITTVENGDPDIIHHPPPKEINGVISETVKEEDQEIMVEELVEEIKSFVEETKVDTEGVDDCDECVSEVIVKKEEQSLDVPLVAPADHEYSAVASSDGGPEVMVAAVKEEEVKVDEKEAESLVIKEHLEEEKSTEAELPASLDRAVGECQYENVESVPYSGGPESARENQRNELITSNQFVHHNSWKDCCGLFDVLTRRSNH